jgi:hypothetical protein
MDPFLQELKSEIDELKVDVKKLEDRIFTFEMNANFNPDDVRYQRLLSEKQLLLAHLCDLRTNIYTKALSFGDGEGPAVKKQKLNNNNIVNNNNSKCFSRSHFVFKCKIFLSLERPLVNDMKLVTNVPISGSNGNFSSSSTVFSL